MQHITRNIIIALWCIFALSMLATWGLFYGISKGVIGDIPPIEELENPKSKFATIVFSCDSVELGRFSQAKENRVYVNYNSLSPYLVQALIATEDERFEEHSGIDVMSLYRAVFKTVLLRQKSAGGGSTITQQLAKLLYTEDPSAGFWGRVTRKPVEWVIAVKLESLYTKEEIVNMYLNHFDFCYNAVGIRSAAHIYFDVMPKDLKIEQAAMLIGMLQNPAMYNPVRRSERTMQRRSVVLKQMEKAGYISQQQYDSLKLLPLLPKVDKKGNYRLANSADHKSGLAPYFREYLRKIMRAKKPERERYASWQGQQFVEDSIAWENDPLYGWCNKNAKPDGTRYNLTSDGLRIYTTIDSRMQRYAEESVVDQLQNNLQPEFFNEKKGQKNAPFSKEKTDEEVKSAMWRAMRQSERYNSMLSQGFTREEIEESFHTPTEMKVFSWEGEIDTIMTPYDSLRWQKQFLRAGFMCMDTLGHVKAYVGGPNFKFFQYDMVTAGRRQVGSTIKPLLYTLYMEEGGSPCDEFLNSQPTLYDANGRPWLPRDAGKDCLGEMVTARWGLMKSNNWISAQVMSKLSPEAFVRMLHSMGIRNNLDPVLSLCLGVCDISVEEMVTAYSSFPGHGQRVSPIFVTSICDNSGVEVAHFKAKRTEVFSYDAYLKMLPILRDVFDHGTGTRIRFRYNIYAQMGGKTGTTNNNSDGWFMAFTPSLVAGTWVGGEEPSIHFDLMKHGQGASMALPIYAKFIKQVYADPTLPYNEEEVFQYPEDYDPCATSHSATQMQTQTDDNFFD